jgi:septal ring factor EnvC (AmiA/AmiB activator)
MSYQRMGETEQRLKAEIDALLKQAEQTDAAEDALYGKDKRGDELPDELSRRESRLKKIQQAKAELEQEAREKATQVQAAAEAEQTARQNKEAPADKKQPDSEPQIHAPEQAKPDAKAQRNFTDPESRIMPDGANKGSFL